jgi:ATP-binding cassette subfamily C protein
MGARVLESYAFAPYVFHLGTRTAELMTRSVAHVNLACGSGLIGLIGALADALLVLALGLALVVASPSAGVLIVLYVGLLAATYSLFARRMTSRLAARLTDSTSGTFESVSSLLRGIRELTVYQLREGYLAEVDTKRRRMIDASRRSFELQEIPRSAIEVMVYSTILVALLVMLRVSDPSSVIPIVALYVLAGLRIMPAIGRMLGSVSTARIGLAAAVDLDQEVRVLGSVPVELSSSAPTPICGLLAFDRVSFRYPDAESPLLGDVTFSIPFGSFLGIVGPSGSGKSTLVALMLGLLQPESGDALYSSQTISVKDPNWLSRVAFVPQDVLLLDRSIEENILAGRDHNASKLANALKRAGLEDFVATLPDGLRTSVSEGGSRLSVGQRQRVGLARALYRSAEILILDEPTSALDAQTEAHVVRTIESLKGQMTIIAVAHRIDTLRMADQILRVQDGHVTQQLTPSAR